MRTLTRLALPALLGACMGCSAERVPLSPKGPDKAPLFMAFMTERAPASLSVPDIYFYDLRTGGPAYYPPNVNSASLEGPAALSGNGRLMAYYLDQRLIGSLATVRLYDVSTKGIRIPGKVNQLTFIQNPTLSGTGRFLAVQYQVSGPFDTYIAVADLAAGTLLQVPNLNGPTAPNFDPGLNGDGTLGAFASNRPGTAGAFD